MGHNGLALTRGFHGPFSGAFTGRSPSTKRLSERIHAAHLMHCTIAYKPLPPHASGQSQAQSGRGLADVHLDRGPDAQSDIQVVGSAARDDDALCGQPKQVGITSFGLFGGWMEDFPVTQPYYTRFAPLFPVGFSPLVPANRLPGQVGEGTWRHPGLSCRKVRYLQVYLPPLTTHHSHRYFHPVYEKCAVPCWYFHRLRYSTSHPWPCPFFFFWSFFLFSFLLTHFLCCSLFPSFVFIFISNFIFIQARQAAEDCSLHFSRSLCLSVSVPLTSPPAHRHPSVITPRDHTQRK